MENVVTDAYKFVYKMIVPSLTHLIAPYSLLCDRSMPGWMLFSVRWPDISPTLQVIS